MYRRLDTNLVLRWGKEHQRSFDGVRKLLTSESVLVHFNESDPFVLSCDASLVGVEAAFAHRDNQGGEQLVAYRSITLRKTEINYAQIDREALAVVFADRHFRKYFC